MMSPPSTCCTEAFTSHSLQLVAIFRIAIQMLFASRAKFIAILLGVWFSSLIMLQQPAIFFGLMQRTYALVTDTEGVDIWVADPNVLFIDDVKPMRDAELYRVKGVQGVAGAYPLYKGAVRARTQAGLFQTLTVIGVDDYSLTGAPTRMVSGDVHSLHSADMIIVDIDVARNRLAAIDANGHKTALTIGDTLEINDKRAVVAGVAELTPNFSSKPTLYTTYSRALTYAPFERNRLSFILVRVAPGTEPAHVARSIQQVTGLMAMTTNDFAKRTYLYYLKNTGIPINFAATVILGLIIGAAIVGQTFYLFAQENRMNYTVMRALGFVDRDIRVIVYVQVLVGGILGFMTGVIAAIGFGILIDGSSLAWYMPWWLVAVVLAVVLGICWVVAGISIRRVLSSHPSDVFRGLR